jgi:septal ring factor EnvC (AmiA/AmiB activator)
LREIDRLQRERPIGDRESRELKARIAKLEADNARLAREIEALRNAKPKAQRRKAAPRMNRGTFAKIARALHPDGRGARTAAELDDACKAFNSWWDTQ